ncbi:MAG: N-acetylmuramoyl-L-alanine amidase, partial [Clostridia bacterium]|nr:N-acetylmuramoyl-L-alanine amidase [Clostridia bacterium]
IDISNLTLLGSVEYLEYAKCIKAWIDGFPKKEDLKNENIAKESEPAPQKEDVPAEEAKESEVPEKDDENTTDETSSSEEDAQSSEKNAKPEDAESDKTKNEESKPEEPKAEEPKAEAPKAEPSKTDVQTIEPPAPSSSGGAKRIIVLDPGHGKSSRLMSTDEKIAAGYCQHNGQWGEWRHWKNGTSGTDCQGSGCNSYGSCWYPMVNGDRDTEPALNLRVALSAKYYLENELGYIVRMTRTSANENPSFSKRVSYCFPGGDFSSAPDAACYVCIHSNAGGGRGSAYIEAKGNYTQKWISPQFATQSNSLGKYINTRIVNGTSLNTYSSGRIGNQGHMILFNKCPVPAGYMEIGFFDSASDLAILNSEYDNIGKSIAYGIHDYLNS